MTSHAAPKAHPYLRAATAGIRHHTRGQPAEDPPDRGHLDLLHAHFTNLHQLIDRLSETARPPHPAAGRHLTTAHTRLWQATTEIHSAFHLLPSNTASDAGSRACHPERLPEGPPVLTICQRHLASGHSIRRKTTPTDLRAHTTASVP